MTEQQKTDLCTGVQGVFYRLEEKMFYSSISITVIKKRSFIHLGHYLNFEHAKQARVIAVELKKEKRKSLRPKHLHESIDRLRDYLELEPIKRINKY